MPSLLEVAYTAARTHMAPKDIQSIFYHHPCKDGVASAITAGMSTELNPSVEYVQFDQRTKFDATPYVGKNVAFFDCAPTPEDYEKLTAGGSKVLVLDHHKAAMDKLQGKAGCFSMPEQEEAGVSMAWAYFFSDKELPELFKLIKDRDTNQNKFSAMNEALYFMLDKRHPRLERDKVAEYLDPVKLAEGLVFGASLVKAQNELIDRLTREAVRGRLKLPISERSCPATFVTVPDWSITGPLGTALYNKYSTDAIVMEHPMLDAAGKPVLDNGNQVFKQYFRAAKAEKGGPNVNDIAREFVLNEKTGGGAVEASGSTWDKSIATVFEPTPAPSLLLSGFTSARAAAAANAAADAVAKAAAGATTDERAKGSPKQEYKAA